MRVASFDVGVFNTGIYIEDFDEKELENIKNIHKSKRYISSGEPTKEFQDILDFIYKNGKCIYIHKIKFLDEKKSVKYIDFDILSKITESIRHLEILKTCDIILIEKQLDINKKAKRIENHISSIISMTINSASIIIYNSSNKTQVLGAPKKVKNKKGKLQNMTKPMRKKWACETTKYILSLRHNVELYEYLFIENKKPDDECDCICQLQSAKYKIFCEKSIKYEQKIGEDTNNTTINDRVFSTLKDRNCEILSLSRPMHLKCCFSHNFWLSDIDILSGKWCQECSKIYKKEIFKSLLNKEVEITETLPTHDVLNYYSGVIKNVNVERFSIKEDDNIVYIPDCFTMNMVLDFFNKKYDDIRNHQMSFFINQELEDIKELSLKHNSFCISSNIANQILFLCSHGVIFSKKLNKINKRCRKFCECLNV
jgi:hypothetical protein